MTPVPARGRRSFTSLLLGALAMGSSFAVLGALVLSDVAAASAPDAPEAELIANVDQKAQVAPPAEPNDSSLREPAPSEPKAKRRPKKKVDFGRFEGY